MHWTPSCGASVCESANFFLEINGVSIQDCFYNYLQDYSEWSQNAPGDLKSFCEHLQVDSVRVLMSKMEVLEMEVQDSAVDGTAPPAAEREEFSMLALE